MKLNDVGILLGTNGDGKSNIISFSNVKLYDESMAHIVSLANAIPCRLVISGKFKQRLKRKLLIH